MYKSSKKTNTNKRWEKGLILAREKAKEWHASDDGKKWHSEHGKKTWINRQKKQKICEQCNKKYYTYWPNKSIYCSKLCGGIAWNKLNPNKIKKFNQARRYRYKKDKKYRDRKSVV